MSEPVTALTRQRMRVRAHPPRPTTIRSRKPMSLVFTEVPPLIQCAISHVSIDPPADAEALVKAGTSV